MTSSDGHVWPWMNPTSPSFSPVAGRIFTLPGRNSSMLVSWFPRTTSIMSNLSKRLSKKSGISLYSCLVEPGTESLTSPITISLVTSSSAESMMVSCMSEVRDVRWNPLDLRCDSTPMWRSPITRQFSTFSAGTS